MDLRDFFFRQTVTPTELREGFELAEAADREAMMALGVVGVCSGATGSANATTLSVDLTAGVVYDQLGQRVAWTGTQTVDVSRDTSGAVTNVVTPGNERWVSIFAVFARLAGNARVDGNGDEVLYDQDESYTFRVLQGAEAAIGVATRPALQGDAILLCDVQLEQGQTLLAGGDISVSRRQWAIQVAAGVGYGTAEEAIAALFGSTSGLVVEEGDDEVALLRTTERPNANDYKLVLQVPVTDSGTVVNMRLYTSALQQGWCITVNARRNNTLNRWEADLVGFATGEFLLSVGGVDGAIITLNARASAPANWTTWSLSHSLGARDGIWIGDSADCTGYVGIQATSGSTVAGSIGTGVQFRKRWVNTPSLLAFTPDSPQQGNVVGTPTAYHITKEGFGVVVVASLANFNTYFYSDFLMA